MWFCSKLTAHHTSVFKLLHRIYAKMEISALRTKHIQCSLEETFWNQQSAMQACPILVRKLKWDFTIENYFSRSVGIPPYILLPKGLNPDRLEQPMTKQQVTHPYFIN